MAAVVGWSEVSLAAIPGTKNINRRVNLSVNDYSVIIVHFKNFFTPQ